MGFLIWALGVLVVVLATEGVFRILGSFAIGGGIMAAFATVLKKRVRWYDAD